MLDPKPDAVEPLSETAFLVSLKQDARLLKGTNGSAKIANGSQSLSLGLVTSGVWQALNLMSEAPSKVETLFEITAAGDDRSGPAQFFACLQTLSGAGLICRTQRVDGCDFVTLVPLHGQFTFDFSSPNANQRYQLIEFAHMYQRKSITILESPLTCARVDLHDWRAAAAVHMLARPRTVPEIVAQPLQLDHEAVANLIGLLITAGLVKVRSHSEMPRNGEDPLACWDHYDLLFHVNSRLGRRDQPYGATYPAVDQAEPLAAIQVPVGGPAIELARPDIDALTRADIPFTRVLEERRSIRNHGSVPISLDEIGCFLFRTARVRGRNDTTDSIYERTSRPYPSPGACYELEIYVVVNECQGLSTGLYYYAPEPHTLHELDAKETNIDLLLRDAQVAADLPKAPQILIVLAARVARMSWKYSSIAYALILKDVGVLIQTMYLVATAMKLAPCALGGGNSDVFAAAANRDYLSEAAVGEFILGSRPGSER